MRQWLTRRGMSKSPVEVACLAVERARLELAAIDPGNRCHLGEIAGREYFIGCLKCGIAHTLLNDDDADIAEQANDALASDPVEEGPIGGRCVDHAVLGHEYVCGPKLCHVAQHVAHQAVVEAPLLPFDQ